MPSARLLLATLVATFTAVPCTAATAQHKLLGLDDMSCAAWAVTRNDSEARLPYVLWVRGFLSGHNYASPARQVAVVSNGTIAAYVDRHCAEKSTSTVATAAMRMSDDYSGRNAPITR